MNRRTFLQAAGGALATAACAAYAARHSRSLGVLKDAMPKSAARMAVYDPALAEGRALARAAARMDIPAFAVGEKFGDDIGMLWHAQLSNRFAVRTDCRTEAPVAALCALRASDRFVLERLAARHRCLVLAAPQI